LETQSGLRASSVTGSEPFSKLSTVGKRRDAHEVLELDSMVLSTDNGAAQSVAEGMGIITARASQKTTTTSG